MDFGRPIKRMRNVHEHRLAIKYDRSCIWILEPDWTATLAEVWNVMYIQTDVESNAILVDWRVVGFFLRVHSLLSYSFIHSSRSHNLISYPLFVSGLSWSLTGCDSDARAITIHQLNVIRL